MNLPGRPTIVALDGGRELWRALDTLAAVTPDHLSGSWDASDASGAGLSLIPVFRGSYDRHGRQVMAATGMTWPVTSSTLTAKLGGLPLKCDLRNNHAAIIYVTTASLTFTGVVFAGTNTIGFFRTDGTALTNADLSGTHVGLTAFYLTP